MLRNPPRIILRGKANTSYMRYGFSFPPVSRGIPEHRLMYKCTAFILVYCIIK